MSVHGIPLDSTQRMASEISDLQYLILVVLRDEGEPLHGYAIHKLVEDRNKQARITDRIGQASVYKSIENLARRQLILPGEKALSETGRPSRQYVLTELGCLVVDAKVELALRIADVGRKG